MPKKGSYGKRIEGIQDTEYKNFLIALKPSMRIKYKELKRCPDCNSPITDKSKKCIKHGHKRQNQKYINHPDLDFRKFILSKPTTQRNPYSPESKCVDCGKYIKIENTRCKSCANKGRLNSNWKKSGMSYVALHAWVHRNKRKPTGCNMCLEDCDKLQAHNISGKYLRDIKDYVWLCAKCHKSVEMQNRKTLGHSRGLPSGGGQIS